MRVEADDSAAGVRLDVWLSGLNPGLSRARIAGVLKAAGLRPAQRLRAGDSFDLDLTPPRPTLASPEDIPLDILYEDEHLIVLDKPAGLVVHAGAGVRSGTLVNALLARSPLSSVGAEALRNGIVHRLDKDTSGAMLAAKTDAAHNALAKMFARHEVRRTYLALAYGLMAPPAGTIEKPLARHPRDRKKMAVSNVGKPAITHYATERVFTSAEKPPLSLLRLNLETGRTHQIRVHLADAGHAILGDRLYAPSAVARLAPRQMLHSADISFAHPITGAPLSFAAPMPPDMASLINELQ